MRNNLLLVGVLIGGILGFTSAKLFSSSQVTASPTTPKNTDSTKWPWPDSLDAVKAAPLSHGIIYEDDKVRILHVTVNPGQLEPVHTHQWRSVAWAAHSAPFTLYHYDLDKDRKLSRTDSFTAQLPLNKANKWAPETPHAIRNQSTDTLVLYRVEFKN
ncbi:MAG TPA: hypothetical protein VHD83_09370 [Puia sp.]|nr:hypothetical protein [Puia sp.]